MSRITWPGGVLLVLLLAGAGRGVAAPAPPAPVPETGPAPSALTPETAPLPAAAPALATAPAPLGPGLSLSEGELGQLVAGVEAFYERVRTMKTAFRQVVRQRTLARTKKASGVIEFAKPGRMRWEYTKPDRVLYVSDGKVLWTYQPEDGLVYKARIEGSRLYHALRFLFGMGDLRKTFDIAAGPAHSPETAFLILTPKDGQQDYKELGLVVDRATFEIRESFLTDPLDNVTHYIFEKPDYEVDVPASRFEFTPPADAQVQEL